MHVASVITILLWTRGCYYSQVAANYRFPVVQTENGFVSGITSKTWRGRTTYTFEGIPYAAPPVGELRFKVEFVNIFFWFFKFRTRTDYVFIF